MAGTQAGPGAAVRCRDLTKAYGSVVALDGLDLDVPAGSVFGLLGPNGAGKTTTLRLLAGLARPTRGTVSIQGTERDTGSSQAGRGVGVLDQDPRYYGWMRGRELVEMAGRLHGLSAAAARARAHEVLARVGLADSAERRIAGYSGGMRQRVGIAQALVDEPPLLLLDEPVSSLDPEGRRDLLALIADLRGSATVVFSTHVLADVERICDRVGILARGRLVAEGPLEDLLARYALPVYRLEPEPGQGEAVDRLAATLGALPWVDGVSVEHGVLTVAVGDEATAARALLPAVVAADIALVSYARVRPTLEDVFLRLVGRDDPTSGPGMEAA